MENKSNEENEDKIEPEQTAVGQNKKSKVFNALKFSWKVLEKIIMVIIIFISLVIITQRVSDNEKAFMGFRIFRVQTGSMVPKYLVGDVIFVREKQLDQIKVGDDVTYWGTSGTMKGKLVTHQVIGIEEIEGQKAFHTKGIANTTEDPIVYGGQINGVVIGKSYLLSTITTALTNQYIFYFGAIIPLTIFIFFIFVRTNNKKFEDYKN